VEASELKPGKRGPYKSTRSELRRRMPVAKVPINDPKHWRKRVEEARTLAHKIADKKGKARMLRLVKQYEKLAEKAEQRSRERSKNSN
jgi:hypothetical protein